MTDDSMADPDPLQAGLNFGLVPLTGVEPTEPDDPTDYEDRPTAWRVRQRYRTTIDPQDSYSFTVELTAGGVVSTEAMDKIYPGFPEFVLRDSPETLEPCDEPATAEPTRHVPTHILSGAARTGAW